MILNKFVLVVIDNKNGLIRIIDQNKENILDIIILYLEKLFDDILWKWLDIYIDRVDEIMVFKEMIFDYKKDIKMLNDVDNKEKCMFR